MMDGHGSDIHDDGWWWRQQWRWMMMDVDDYDAWW